MKIDEIGEEGSVTEHYKNLQVLIVDKNIVIIGWRNLPGAPQILGKYSSEKLVITKRRAINLVRLVPCRTCGAAAGKFCISKRGTEWEGSTNRIHKLRRQAAREAKTHG